MGEFKVPNAPPINISPHLQLQPPLSRRGHGPGLILVLNHFALLEASEKHIDPPPLTKWAEEGYAVVQILVPASKEDGGEFPLQKAVEALKDCEQCDNEGGFGLISYVTRIPFYVVDSTCLSSDIRAIISYSGHKFSPLSSEVTTIPPQLLHIGGPKEPRRESYSLVPEENIHALRPLSTSHTKSFRYKAAKKDSAWILPSDEDYHAVSANLAHSRSLSFLKPLLGGPNFDIENIWEEHCRYEFEERDVDATMATMVAEPYVNHVPVLTGGIGREKLTRFYAEHFVFANPRDTSLDLVSRTVGVDRVVDEFVFSLTHDRVVDWLLPGVPPTGKHLQIPFTSIVAFRGDRLCHEHISWDQGTALRQAGLLPEWINFPYPIDGEEASGGKSFEVRLPIVGADTAKKLVEEGSVNSNELIAKYGEKSWREVEGR